MLDQPPQNKMIAGAPAKKEYHFAATAEHLAEVVQADSIEEAEATYRRVKRRIAPDGSSDSTPGLTEEAPEEQSTPCSGAKAAERQYNSLIWHPKGIGRLIQVGMAKESTRGTAKWFGLILDAWIDLTLDEKKEFAADDRATASSKTAINLTQTKKWAQGSLAGKSHDQTIRLDPLFDVRRLCGTGPLRRKRVYDHTFTRRERAAPVADVLPPRPPLGRRLLLRQWRRRKT